MAANFRVAAQRTYRDAAYLEQHPRIANADHLYGLAAECALKAILVGLRVIPPQGPPRKSPFREHIDKLWDQYSLYVSAQGPVSYSLPITAKPFDAWRVDHRYEDDLLFTQGRLNTTAQGACEANRLLEQAILDGVVA